MLPAERGYPQLGLRDAPRAVAQGVRARLI